MHKKQWCKKSEVVYKPLFLLAQSGRQHRQPLPDTTWMHMNKLRGQSSFVICRRLCGSACFTFFLISAQIRSQKCRYALRRARQTDGWINRYICMRHLIFLHKLLSSDAEWAFDVHIVYIYIHDRRLYMSCWQHWMRCVNPSRYPCSRVWSVHVRDLRHSPTIKMLSNKEVALL